MYIEVQNLTFRYGNRLALDQLSFTLEPGLNILLGPNGAGKSTLFALLTQLYALQDGDVLINNKPLSRAKRAYLKQLGVVFQQSTLDLDLSIEQNLCYYAALHGISGKECLSRAVPLLEHFALQDRLKDKVRTLNGGHRRRVEIVRALMHSPSFLLLDEPSAGLDPATRARLSEAVREICRQRPLCVLWATHIIEEVSSDDNVLILHQGKLRDAGKAQILSQKYNGAQLSDIFSHLTAAGENDVLVRV
ncbi:ATP-binding cassette domain-containing protein [Parasalinivibrio latis]|uniref:ABC transporter ATP-binding protein n=1 Tax=Parasalinivibrio latis TaxID=2952610 RepID=UPI0030DEBFA5